MDWQARPHQISSTVTRLNAHGLLCLGNHQGLVYSRKPKTVEDLRRFVIDAYANFDHDLCTSVCRECIEAKGLQFEHLL